MPRHVAFLRAINVGGRFVTMDALRGHFEALKLGGVETFIASGNVIFESRAAGPALEKRIEALLLEKLGYETTTFVRGEDEVIKIARAKPFEPARIAKAGAFCVAFLKEPLDARAKEALETLKTAADDFATQGRELYWLCATRQSESEFSNALFEKKTGARATFRNMNTLARLAEKLAA